MTRLFRLGRCSVPAVVLCATLALHARPLRAQETLVAPGETIRIEVGSEVAGSLGVPTSLEGTFIMFRDDALVASSPYYGRVALPLGAVLGLEVQRRRKPIHAAVRGGIAGAAFGIGMWRFLRILCREGCDDGLGSAWLPATASGVFVGGLVAGQGPGTSWVRAGLPPSPPPPGALLSWRLPLPNR